MSILPKIWNLCNFNNILSFAASNFTRKLQSGETVFQRFYSKRFTYCNKCIKCPKKDCSKKRTKAKKKPKQVKTEETKPKRSKSAKDSQTCIPFQTKQKKKKPVIEPAKKKPRKCKPGMKDPCGEVECQAQCSLTKAKKLVSTDTCDARGSWAVKDCPKGDWEREK